MAKRTIKKAEEPEKATFSVQVSETNLPEHAALDLQFPAGSAEPYMTKCGSMGVRLILPATELYKLGASLMQMASEMVVPVE